MPDNTRNRTWTARQDALESVLGKADDTVLHAMLPFHLGGQADVLSFHGFIPGRVSATCELLGEPSQKRNQMGTFELMIAHRDDNNWGPNVISKLARYTCDTNLEPGHTMDIGSAVPKGSTIAGFFFVDFERFKFKGRDAGLLLCIGVTADELAACRQRKQQQVFEVLKSADVYPYTDLFRPSTLPPSKGGFWSRLTGGGR
jgi:hypothetical protein